MINQKTNTTKEVQMVNHIHRILVDKDLNLILEVVVHKDLVIYLINFLVVGVLLKEVDLIHFNNNKKNLKKI